MGLEIGSFFKFHKVDSSAFCWLIHAFAFQIGAAETKKDPYEEYTYEMFFKEDSLVLSSQDVIPVAAEFALACQPTVRPKDALPFQQARVSGQPVLLKGRSAMM